MINNIEFAKHLKATYTLIIFFFRDTMNTSLIIVITTQGY